MHYKNTPYSGAKHRLPDLGQNTKAARYMRVAVGVLDYPLAKQALAIEQYAKHRQLKIIKFSPDNRKGS